MPDKEIILNGLRNIIKKAINEINWADEFSDVEGTCIDTKELVNYLNRIVSNKEKSYKDRERFNQELPYLHTYSKHLKSEDNNIDVDHFISSITQPPLSIISKNEKIEQTGKANEFVYNTGIPAFRGIVYDIENNKFYVINTCPGAGACKAVCYALKGNYVMYKAS